MAEADFQAIEGMIPDRPLFMKVWGSHSHNTALPTSDVDYLAVYAASAVEMLSMNKPPLSVANKKPDLEAHEVEKFCNLLIKGNPSMVEMLFTDKMYWAADEWMELREVRGKFLSAQAVLQYVGYANGQLARLGRGARLHTGGGEYSPKWAYHMLRVLGDATSIAEGGYPIVWKEGPERDLLMDVRLLERTPEQVVAMAEQRLDHIESLKPWPLPDEGDRVLLNDWLLWVRGLRGRPEG